MTSPAHTVHHPALWLRAIVSSRRASRSASASPRTTRDTARIGRRPFDDAVVARCVAAGVLQTRWA
jgi:hypothetical protein